MLNDDRNLAPIAPNLDLGAESALAGPFGARRIVYADFTASGRSLPAIEQAIREHVLPTYGNTHTDASHTGATTTRLREEARAAIRRGVNAGDEHAVIFTGSGTTAAVNKLVAMLGLAGPSGDRDRELLRAAVPPAERPVVFVGPFEHHSNELPWREALATVVRLPLDEAGHICLRSLAAALADHAGRPHRYVAISAASNVTGVITETAAVAHVAHKYGARIFVDYAAGGPYLPIDMRGTGQGDHLDAVYFSPHKFLGGPGASGVLVCDRTLHRIARPTMPGGGTVRYVSATQQHYLADVELIEEAGTPAIIGDIRAGLVVQLKSDIGADAIRAAEHSAVARAFRRWGSEPAIEILGPLTATRLPIFSFNITSGGRVLHHNFVVRLLNDLFGIQARGGCSCAGPYGHELLHIGETQSAMYRDLIDQGHELFKPGWVRVGLHFSMSAATQAYILDAVAFIARHGAAFLGAYTPDLHSGLWSASTPRRVAGAESWDRLCAWRGPSAPLPDTEAPDFAACLRRAADLAATVARAQAPASPIPGALEPQRWFRMPGDRDDP